MIPPPVCRPSGVREVLREGMRRLAAAGVEHPRTEAEWLLSALVGAKPLELYLETRAVASGTVKSFFSQVEARSAGLPLQYLVGEAEFFGLQFQVAPGVFIPRPETESVVSAALAALQPMAARGRGLRIVDVGTGSGCIAVTLARHLPSCVVVGVEVSWIALCTAVENVRRHGLSRRIHLVQGQWLEAVRGRVDAVVANPPYIPTAAVQTLPLDVRQEPRVSLDGGMDGMRDLRRILADAERVVVPGGLVVFECGEEQVDDVVRDARSHTWIDAVSPLNDLARRPRGVVIRRTA